MFLSGNGEIYLNQIDVKILRMIWDSFVDFFVYQCCYLFVLVGLVLLVSYVLFFLIVIG